jgi:hypothetical protein
MSPSIQLKITCDYCGGLGNQLFQFYTTIAHAIEWKAVFYFSNSETSPSITHRNTYWKTFLKSFQIFLKSEAEIRDIEEKETCVTLREKEFLYHPLEKPQLFVNGDANINIDINIDVIKLSGYFQSYLYFEKHFQTINRMIRLEEQQNSVIEKYNRFITSNSSTISSSPFSKETPNKISIHFRLGDYVKLQHFHPITPDEYYSVCLMYILMEQVNIKQTEPMKFSIYYFCEDDWLEYVQTNYIEKLLDSFGKSNRDYELNFIPVTTQLSSLEDWEQMLLMSCCDINIIGNSTFSLWAAYFNAKFSKKNNQNTYVYYPKKWFAESAGHNVKNLFKSESEGWRGIDVMF